nr:MAG TPA: hypothetical protein [Caudoviricetes sp.]
MIPRSFIYLARAFHTIEPSPLSSLKIKIFLIHLYYN